MRAELQLQGKYGDVTPAGPADSIASGVMGVSVKLLRKKKKVSFIIQNADDHILL